MLNIYIYFFKQSCLVAGASEWFHRGPTEVRQRVQLLRRAQLPLPGRKEHGLPVRPRAPGRRRHPPAVHDAQHDGAGRTRQVHEPHGGAGQTEPTGETEQRDHDRIQRKQDGNREQETELNTTLILIGRYLIKFGRTDEQRRINEFI